MSDRTSNLNLFKWNTQDDADLNSNFDIESAMNDNWDKIDTAFGNLSGNKVDKEEGKGLSTEDYSTEEKEKLEGIEDGAQENVLENLVLNGNILPKENKAINIKDEEVVNARQSTIKDKTFASVDARIEELEEDVDKMNITRGHVYTVRRKITNNTATTWERLDDAVGLVANATKNGGVVANDFDNLAPWKDIVSFNLDLTTGRKNAYYGDADFKFDGSNGDVYTHIPTFWLKIWEDNDYMYISIADYNRAGYTEIKEFDIARYLLGIGTDDKPHSYSGLRGADFKNINTYRNLVKNSLGTGYCLMDWRYFAIQCLYLVEYADFNSQSKLGNGCSQMRHNTNDVALVADTNTTSFVVNTTAGNAFVVGQQVRIGTYESAQAVERTITAINDYDDGEVTGKEIVLNEAVDNITLSTKIWTGVQAAGQCDALGMKSGCLVDDQKHNVIYRGIEGILGNIYAFVDGINIKDRVAWICYDPTEYASDKFEAPYEELGYTNASSNGYAKTLGFDINHPLAQFPIENGAGTTSGTSDYYYQDAGNRVARVGGYSNIGANCGLWCWGLSGPSSHAAWPCGARVLKYQ